MCSIDARASLRVSLMSLKARTYLEILQGSVLAFQVDLSSIVLSHGPPSTVSLLTTLLAYRNTMRASRDLSYATRYVPRHSLLDARMGAYRVYHCRYSPYMPLIPVDREMLQTWLHNVQEPEEIFTAPITPVQVSSLAAFSASSQVPSTDLQGFSAGLEYCRHMQECIVICWYYLIPPHIHQRLMTAWYNLIALGLAWASHRRL